MRIPRLFVSAALDSNTQIALPVEQSHYLGKVLRLTAGSPVILFNGKGGQYHGEVINLEKRTVRVAIGKFDPVNNESPLHITLAIAISRGDRMDSIMQKATELGVTQIAPLFTARTEVKLRAERLEKKLQHWQQIVISACEQCQRNLVPTVTRPLDFSSLVNKVNSDLKLVLHHRTENRLSQITSKPESITLLIGPEGGLSAEEIALAEQHQFQALALGPRVLRTETAPLTALTILQYQWGDLN